MNGGALMELSRPIRITRRDSNGRALIALAGELDLESAPLVHESLSQCLREGIRVIDVDLAAVTFCDCTGLGAILGAAQRAKAAGTCLRLRRPRPAVVRLFVLTGYGALLPDDEQPSEPTDALLRGPPEGATAHRATCT
jgi:anti-sigma B factor antagonist